MNQVNLEELPPDHKAFLFNWWANKIIERACLDYRTAIKQNKTSLLGECEAFFRSEWFAFLTDYDPDFLMKRIQKSSVAEIEDWKRRGLFHRNGKYKEVYKIKGGT